MGEFKSMSLADQVFEQLENEIIQGILPRGEVLTELKLVQRLGVSRTPIREALRQLAQERLVRETGKGSVVLGIPPEDLEDIMDIREYLEGMAARYTAAAITPARLKELQDIMDLQEFYFNRQDKEHMRQMDDAFHDAICRFSGRTVIADTLQPLHRKTRRYRKTSIDVSARSGQSVQEHRDILNAIAVGDSALAEKLMATHIRNAKDNMMKNGHKA